MRQVAYQALYRRWRPQTFDEIVGQEHVTRILANAVAKNRIAHAYLFCGPRGVGKTSTARILAKAINCEHGPTAKPCGQCAICRGITSGSMMDVLEIDAASNNGVDEIRDLREKVKYAATDCRYKVYIIDEVHMLSSAAFNALLKTLEEPPHHVVFILATTEAHKIPATIASRCQRFDFHRIALPTIVASLKEIAAEAVVDVAEDALQLIARAADGALRDAISILDQCLSINSEKITINDILELLGTVGDEVFWQLTEYVRSGNMARCFELVDDLYQQGKDLERFVSDYLQYLRSLMQLMARAGEPALIMENPQRAAQQAEILGRERLLHISRVMVEALQQLKYAYNKQIVLEMALLECWYTDSQAVAALAARVARLEQLVGEQASGSSSRVCTMQEVQETLAGNNDSVKPVVQVQQEQLSAEQQDQPQLQAVSSELSIGNIRARWNDILAAVKRRNVIAHALLREGEPAELTGDILVLKFGSDFHCDQVTRTDKRQVVLEALVDVLGTKLDIRGRVENNDVSEEQEEENTPVVDNAVQQALAIFGGQVIKKEEFNSEEPQ